MPYTREEANNLLPELRQHLVELKQAFALQVKHQEEVEEVRAGNGGGPGLNDFLQAARVVSDALRWIADRGIVLRDVSEGLCDFPGEINGKDVFLCWKLGEESVDHWHELDSGFSGRKPLD